MANADIKNIKQFKSNQCMKQDKTKEVSSPGPILIIPSWDPVDRTEKPPYSYATIIAHAILSSKERKMTLSEIYAWVMENYPFYCTTNLGWQNSIRHNLSLHKSFVKIQRDASNPNHPRKGCYWTVKSGRERVFIENLELPVTRRIGRRRSSQTSVCSSIPYPAEPSADVVHCSSKSSIGSCNSVYTKSSSPASSCDLNYYQNTSSIPTQCQYPFSRTFFTDSLFLEPIPTNILFPTFYDNYSSWFN